MNEHVASEKKGHFTVIVNARPKNDIEADRLSYDDVVKLAFGQPAPNIYYTVTFTDGPKANPQGTMSSGDTVEIKSGMKFYVTPTTQS
jgi:hypothetical protein